MTGLLDDLSAAQLRSAIAPCTSIAATGAMLAARFAPSPVSPYFTERLIYQRLLRNARDAEDGLDEQGLYASIFSARPEGWQIRWDAGAVTRFHALFEDTIAAIEAAPPFPVPRRLTGMLRAQADRTPAPIRALARARDLRLKGASEAEANLAAQRVLAAEGMFADRPLPCFIEIPRLRRDGDWLIGALRRLAEALSDTLDAFNAAEGFLARAHALYPPTKAKQKAARRALPLLAGFPVLHSPKVAEILGISLKAAIAAMSELETAGLAREITGQERYQAFVANDPVLGLPEGPQGAPALPLVVAAVSASASISASARPGGLNERRRTG